MRGCGEGIGDQKGVAGGFPGAKVKCFEASVSEPAVEGGRDGADCVL